MRRELSLRGFCWVEAIHSHFPFTLPKTHYCGIGHRAKCNLFCPVLCLIKKMPRLFAIISFLVYAINTDVVFLRPYWKSTVLGRNTCPTIHQQAQKTCSSLLSAVQSLNSGFSDFISWRVLSPLNTYCSGSDKLYLICLDLAIDPKISSSIFVDRTL